MKTQVIDVPSMADVPNAANAWLRRVVFMLDLDRLFAEDEYTIEGEFGADGRVHVVIALRDRPYKLVMRVPVAPAAAEQPDEAEAAKSSGIKQELPGSTSDEQAINEATEATSISTEVLDEHADEPVDLGPTLTRLRPDFLDYIDNAIDTSFVDNPDNIASELARVLPPADRRAVFRELIEFHRTKLASGALDDSDTLYCSELVCAFEARADVSQLGDYR